MDAMIFKGVYAQLRGSKVNPLEEPGEGTQTTGMPPGNSGRLGEGLLTVRWLEKAALGSDMLREYHRFRYPPWVAGRVCGVRVWVAKIVPSPHLHL